MTPRGWLGLIAAAGLAIAAGAAGVGTRAHAIHVSTDVPLSIAPEDVQRYREAGEDVVVIDLRTPDAFRAGHLPRARSLPLSEMRQRAAEVPRTGRVVLYAGAAEEATAAYQALRNAGHRNVMVLAGGLAAWVRLGFPVETGQ